MKTMKIYEPAMCCPTGLCGVGVDPELLRVSTVLNTLKQNGIAVERFNLTSAPAEFVKSKTVTEFLQKFGPDKLPVTVVDDFIVIAGRYPTNEEFTEWLELPKEMLGGQCCCGEASEGSCCCEDAAEEDCCCGSSDGDCCCGDSADEGCCCGDSADGDCCCGDSSDEGCCCGDSADGDCCCSSSDGDCCCSDSADETCCCGENTDKGCCC